MKTRTSIQNVLEQIELWLSEEGSLFPNVESLQEHHRENLQTLRGLGARLEAPLFILLCGGTGAGKSTLLNALAGSEIAKASPVRPTTTRVTVYHHAHMELLIPEELRSLGSLVAHNRPELQDKVIIDAPDFDSTALANHDILRQVLRLSDLVLLLATPEKYANYELFELARSEREGRTFYFVMNRLDQGIPSEVLEDFQEELARAGFAAPVTFAISARAELHRRLKSSEAAEASPIKEEKSGDFPKLEALIEHELSLVRIREIKRHNVDVLLRRLLTRMHEGIPSDLAKETQLWLRDAEQLIGELRATCTARFAEVVHNDNALQADLEARLATRYTGLLGGYQAILWGLRGLRGRGALAVPAALASQLGDFHALTEPAPLTASTDSTRLEDDHTLAGEVHVLSCRLDGLGVERGLLTAAAPIAPDEAQTLATEARLAAAREVATVLRAVRCPGPLSTRQRLTSWLLNLPALAAVCYTFGRWLYTFLHGGTLLEGWFAAGAIVTLLCLYLCGKLADALARRQARSLKSRMAKAAGQVAEAHLTRPLIRRIAAHNDALVSAEAHLRTLIQSVSKPH